MGGGASFTRAVRESEGVFDTHGWWEVLSRLRRARGCVLKAAAVLGVHGNAIISTDGQRQADCGVRP